MSEQADAIAVLEHEVRAGKEIGVAASHLNHARRLVARQRELAELLADHGRARGEDAKIVEVPAILGHAPVRRLAKGLLEPIEHRPVGCHREQHVALAEHDLWRRRLIPLAAAESDDPDFRGKDGRQLAQTLAEVFGAFESALEQRHPGARRDVDLGPQQREGEKQEQDGPGHAEGIGDRVSNGGVVISERRDRGLERRGGRSRAREEAEGVAGVEIQQLDEEESDGSGEREPDQSQQIVDESRRTREPREELLPVLDADRVEKERESEGSQHRRGRRLGGEPTHPQRDEENGSHPERESPDVQLPEQVSDRRRQEERHQRLLLERDPDEVHVPPQFGTQVMSTSPSSRNRVSAEI